MTYKNTENGLGFTFFKSIAYAIQWANKEHSVGWNCMNLFSLFF